MSTPDHDKDWHPAEVVCELKKKGISLSRLARENGYKSATPFTMALRQSYPKVEAIIAEAVGVTPQAIWPKRIEARRERLANLYGAAELA